MRCGPAGCASPWSGPLQPQHRRKSRRARPTFLKGVVSEQRIAALAGKGTLRLGATAVLTPLARDKARKLGLKLERRG